MQSLTANKKLIGALTGQWGDYGLPPAQSSFAMHALVAKHYLDGGNYPRGTSRRIAETISDVIEKNGGKLIVNAGVSKILISGGKAMGVLMENGDKIISKNVVSGVGAVNTFAKMVEDSSLGNISIEKIKEYKTNKELCLPASGAEKSAKDLKLKNTNLWIYPGYDHDLSVKNYLDNPESEFPLVYVSFPSAKDDTWDEKHPNSTTIEAIIPSRMSWYSKWEDMEWKKRGEEYEAHKARLSKTILDVIVKHVPNIKDSIDYQELSTPLTVRDLANYSRGENLWA